MKQRHSLAVVALSLCLLIYAGIGLFMRPVADDFCELVTAKQSGPLGMMTVMYQTWSGRFSLFALKGALYSAFGASLPALVPFLLIVSLAAIWAWAIRPLTRSALLIVLAVTFGTVAGLPNIYQNLYWSSASLMYFAPIVASGLLVGALLRRWHPLIVAGLAFVAAGFNEPHALVQATLLAAALWRWRSKVLLAALAFTFLGLIVNAVAPGNALRASFVVHHLTIVGALADTFKSVTGRGIETLSYAPLAVLIPFVAGLSVAPDVRLPLQLRRINLLWGAALALAVVSILPVQYIMTGADARAYTLEQALLSTAALLTGMVLWSGRRLTCGALSSVVAATFFVTLLWGADILPGFISFSRNVDSGRGSDFIATAAGIGKNSDQWVADCRKQLAILTVDERATESRLQELRPDDR